MLSYSNSECQPIFAKKIEKIHRFPETADTLPGNAEFGHIEVIPGPKGSEFSGIILWLP
jgi:hypothetical protein